MAMTSPKPRIFDQSEKLKGIAYDIRGEVSAEAERMELDGHTILKLNTADLLFSTKK